jgi:Domain of unknown function (DUF6930)
MNSLKTIQKLPQQEFEIWEGGRIKMPTWITGERRGPYRPVFEIWVEEQSGAIIIHNMERDLPALQKSVDLVLKAMTKSMAGPARRPTHLRVIEKDFAELLREKLGSIGITVELVDRFQIVDKVVALMKKHMGKDDEGVSIPGLLSLEGVTPERAEAFFRAAVFFYEQAPWRFIADRTPLQVSCTAFFRSPVYLAVMGNGGTEFGLGLFLSAEELERVYEIGSHFDMDRMSFRTASVIFSEPIYLAFEDLDAIELHGWPIAGPEAYPHLLQILPGADPPIQPPSPDHVNIFEACLLALPPTIKKHQADIRAARPFAEEVAVDTFYGKLQVKITSSP